MSGPFGEPDDGGPTDLAAVAEALGVTFDADATALGVDPEDLRRLMGPPGRP